MPLMYWCMVEAFRVCALPQLRRAPAEGSTTGPGEVGLKTARMLINGQIGASVYSAAYCAHILLGGKDCYTSFSCVPFAVWLFTECVMSGAGGDKACDANFTAAPMGSTGARWVSHLDDYKGRPRELRAMSPYVWTMCYKIEKQNKAFLETPADLALDEDAEGSEGADGSPSSSASRASPRKSVAARRLRLHPDHPRCTTHMAVRLRQPVVPQLLSDAPVRPTDSEEHTREHDVYAAFVLGTHNV